MYGGGPFIPFIGNRGPLRGGMFMDIPFMAFIGDIGFIPFIGFMGCGAFIPFIPIPGILGII